MYFFSCCYFCYFDREMWKIDCLVIDRGKEVREEEGKGGKVGEGEGKGLGGKRRRVRG